MFSHAEVFFVDTAALHVKHGGLLGLSACVLAFPYDVPLWMPEVLLDVGNYLHDAPQIQVLFHTTLTCIYFGNVNNLTESSNRRLICGE